MADIWIREEHLCQALTVDQLIAELQAIKDSGLADGSVKVCFGTSFMQDCFTARSVVLLENRDGVVTAGVSSNTERQWADELALKRLDPSQNFDELDKVKLALDMGFIQRASEHEAKALSNVGEVKPTKKLSTKKSL